MSFLKPQQKISSFGLGLPIAFLLTLLLIRQSSSTELGWKELNAAMESREQLFGDHAWQAGTAPNTAFYVGVFEIAFPQGYWRLSKDKSVPAPEIHQTIRKYVKKGTPVTFLFFSNPDFQRNAQLRFSLKKVKAPYTTLWTTVSKLDINDSNWSRHYIKMSFPCPEIKPGEVNFSVALEPPTHHAEFGTTWFFISGKDDPTIEKPVVAPKDNAHLDAERLLMDNASQTRINRIRRGKMIVTVQDQNGKPLPGASIKLRMLRQGFAFGCALKQSQLTDPQFQQSKLAKTIFSTFNTALVELDWATIERSKGSFDFAALEKSIDFLKQNNMTVSVALWSPGQKLPDWLSTSKATAGSAIRGYVSHTVARLHSKVESFHFSLDQGGIIGEWVDHSTPRLAGEKLLVWSRVAAPETKTKLVFRVDDATKMQSLFNMMARDGNVPDAFSISMPIVSPTVLDSDEWIILDPLKRLSTGLYIRGWIQTTKKSGPIDEYEAHTLTRLYKGLFSNPSVQAIIFPEPVEAASLVGTNGTTTPLYKMLNTLIHVEWIRNFSGESDRTGQLNTHSFFGVYEIIADDKKGHSAKTEVDFSDTHPLPQEVTLKIKTN
ncbi:unnamed protein product [Sphagnum balticum]